MKALIIRTTQITLACLLIIADEFTSAQVEVGSNIYRAGIADGVWPLWIGLFLVLLLAMYAKVALAEE